MSNDNINAEDMASDFQDLYEMFSDANEEYEISDSPFNNINTCEYYEPTELSSMFSAQSNLSCFHLNCRGLSANWEQFYELMLNLHSETFSFDFICVSESYKCEHDQRIFISGYQPIITRQRENQFRGGVAMFIKCGINYKIRDDISIFIPHVFESLFIECCIKSQNVIVGVIYRPNTPPKEDVDACIHNLNIIMETVNNEKKNSIIMGDFNIDLLKYGINNKTNIYLDSVMSNGFIPMITKPTRKTHSTSTLIDHIHSNFKCINSLSGIVITDVADHYGIFHAIPIKKTKHVPQSAQFRRKINDKNMENFKTQLSQIDFSFITQYSDVNECYDAFLADLTKIFDLSFPLVKGKSISKYTKRQPWFTKGLVIASIHKHKLFRKKNNKPTDNNIDKYKIYNQIYNKVRKLAKSFYFRDKFEEYKHDMRKTWGTLNTLMGRRNGTDYTKIDKINVNNDTVEDTKGIANAFNNFFANIGNDTSNMIPSVTKSYKSYLQNPSIESFFIEPVNELELLDIITKLKCKKSSGSDGISSKLLKICAPYLVIPLSHIINLSFTTGKIPDKMKQAKVIPVHKAGNPAELSNYRPISLLPTFSKVLERAMYNKLFKFLESYNILYKHQYGFRAKHSTIHPLIHLLNHIATSYNEKEKKITIGLFCDLSKAFDVINHEILLYKLNYYGIRGHAHNWFLDYLTGRSQFVQIEYEKSTNRSITCGVPQGSILGPLLFLLYVNDINKSCEASILSFADDTTAYISESNNASISEKSSNMVQQLYNWFCANKLFLNAKKTKFITFAPCNNAISNNNIEISINDVNLNRVGNGCNEKFVKFLGIHLDDSLSWKYHIDYICNKISRTLFALRQTRNILSTPSMLMLYNALIHPYISYGILAWGNASQTMLNRILLLQKRALRLIHKRPYNSHTDPLFSRSNVLKVQDSYEFAVRTFMYDYEHNNLPLSYHGMFRLNCELQNRHQTRQCDQYYIPKATSKFVGIMPLYKYPQIFNTVKKESVQIECRKNVFKRKQKDLLIAKYLVKKVCFNPICSDCHINC